MKKDLYKKFLTIGILLILFFGTFAASSLNLNNKPLASVTIELTVGNPNMTGSGGAPDWWATTNTPLTIDAFATGSNLISVKYRINSGSWINIPLNELPYTIYFTEECVHVLDIQAEDDQGNTDYLTQTFYVDDSPPGMQFGVFDPVQIHSSGAYLVTDDSAAFFAVFEQGSSPCIVGYLTVYYSYWFEGVWTNYSQSFNQHGAVGYQQVDVYQEDGVHHFNWYSKDGLGNRWPTSTWWNETFYVDNLPPDFELNVGDPHYYQPGYNRYVVTTATEIMVNATDNDTYYPAVAEHVDLYHRTWHNNNWTPWTLLHNDTGTVTWLFTLDSEGTHYINYFAADWLSNPNPETGSYNTTFFVDDTEPIIIDFTPEEGYAGEEFTFSADVLDNINVSEVKVEYWYGSSSHTTESMEHIAGDTWQKTIILDNILDELFYKIIALDVVYNYHETDVKNVTLIDITSPEITDNSPTQATGAHDYTFNATITDNIEVDSGYVDYWFDQGTPTNESMIYVGDDIWEETITINPTAEFLNYKITSIDSSGNWAETTIKSIPIVENEPPNMPTIDGPDSGKPGNEYTYCVIATDPNDDQMEVMFEWGDETNSDWLGPFDSGTEVCDSHIWDKKGAYVISVTVRDIYGENVTATKEVTMPRNKLILRPLIFRLLERFPFLLYFLKNIINF